MRIIHVHNHYSGSAPSGENVFVRDERKALKEAGCEVIEHNAWSERRQSTLRRIATGISALWNEFERSRLTNRIVAVNPDIVHIHNTFPVLSPAVLYAKRKRSTALVATVHNYRAFCPAGVAFRDGVPCTSCLDRDTVVPAVVHACYRHSHLASLSSAAVVALHKRLRTWAERPDATMVLNDLQKELLTRLGFAAERLHTITPVYSHAVDDYVSEANGAGSKFVILVSRLSEEKGVDVAIRAWRHVTTPIPLIIVGDGPARDRLVHLASSLGLRDRVCFAGLKSFSDTQELMAQSQLVVFTTRCFEGFPLVIREALALSKPLVAAASPGVSTLLEDGWNALLYPFSEPIALAKQVDRLIKNASLKEQLTNGARSFYESALSPEACISRILDVYRGALEFRRSAD